MFSMTPKTFRECFFENHKMLNPSKTEKVFFNGTEAVKKYYAINHYRGQVNFSILFKDAGDTYIRLKNKLFIPKAIRSREYRINPNYLISS